MFIKWVVAYDVVCSDLGVAGKRGETSGDVRMCSWQKIETRRDSGVADAVVGFSHHVFSARTYFSGPPCQDFSGYPE